MRGHRRRPYVRPRPVAAAYDTFEVWHPTHRELAALRLLAPTINMIVNAGRDPSYAAEARARMRYWLGDPAAPMWTPL